MRNLKRIKESTLHVGGVSAIAYDLEDLVFAVGPSHASRLITLRRLDENATAAEDAIAIASWDATSDDHILDIRCFPDVQTISVILAGGDIVIVRQNPTGDEDQIEIIGTVDAGIAAVAWNPDEELVAIATKADTLLFMTRDFDLVSDVTLSLDDVKVSGHVSVGWGKKETQFKGRGVAKTLRDPTMPEHVDEGSLNPNDDLSVALSWRGDGHYLAMNSIVESEPRRRMIRVYSREGVLESVSEPVNGLDSALSWKPSGQTIAGVRKLGSSVDVVLFERNGLRHGDFSLRLNVEEVDAITTNTQLHWNQDSSVLAVVLRDRMQLWTTSNYHWYLKQEILASDKDSQPRFAWHPEHPLQLSIFGQTDLVRQKYTTAVARGSVLAPHDHGLVAVIDGKTLKVTPLRSANVPPPMAHDEIELSSCVNDVVFFQEGNETLIHALLANEQTSVWRYEHDTMSKSRFTVVSSGTEFAKVDGEKACVLGRYTPEVPPLGLGEVSLTESGMLRIAGPAAIEISGVTSFVATDLYLVFTTSNHLLKFVHLSESGDLQIPPDEPETDERCRSIERGAKIVTVMPSAYSLVLQMPRGNLETIFPRALVLAGIRQALSSRQYKKAFSICRVHRVDMNILHDYAPEQFMNDIPALIKQVKKPEHIDLFLSSLSEEDVAKTIYKETLQQRDSQLTTNGHCHDEPDSFTFAAASASKINRVCDAFLDVLRQQQDASLQNIVTAHVCKSPPDLEAGLALISDLRRAGNQRRLEQAVEHICFLADVNQLYDTALGSYDLEVTLLVAQQSQKDPREYLPYLQKLQDMPELKRQYTIDDYLHRFQKALSHLYALGDFEDVKEYMVKHDLYTSAMELCRYDTSKLGEIMRLQAGYLSSRNRYAEAGIAYEYVQDHKSAYDAYRSAGLWRECLSSAASLPVSEEVMSSLASDVAATLEEAKDFFAAATVHLEYMSDLPTAMRLLCRGFHFSEASRLAALHRKQELLPSILDPGLIEASATMTEMLAEMKSQLRAQVPRLQDLRRKKAEDPIAFLDGADGGDDDIPDNLSLAPTNASTTGTFMTRYTNKSTGTLATNATRKTSKNRRREERKRARGKKGTVYEEEYLVNSITRLVERLNDTCEDISQLVDGLLRRAMRERALAVDKAMGDLMEACKGSLDEVFMPEMHTSGEGEQRGEVKPSGGQGVLWEALVSSGPARSAPVLKVYRQSSLLA